MALDSVLANIPGYGGFAAKRQMNQQQDDAELQRAQVAMGIMAKIREAKQDETFRVALAESGGDVEKALEIALKGGNVNAAAKLAPLVKMVQERKEGEQTRKGLSALLDPQEAPPQNPMTPGPGASVMAGSGAVAPTVPAAPSPSERRLAHLDQLSRIYATNPTVMKQIEVERGKIAAASEKAPQRRERVAGENLIQEEYVNGKWQEIGRGPRFSRQPQTDKTYPIVTTGDGIFERRPEGLVQLKDPNTGQPLKPTARERPITEYQGKNALYGARALQADKALLALEEKISLAGLATKQAVQGTPIVGGPLGALGNVMLSADQQRVEQAQRNFVNAVLRQESGAVISDAEFENAKKQYFPQPGDTKEVLEQKRQNRRTAIEGFKRIAGPAWNEVEEGESPAESTPAPTPTPAPAKFEEGKVYVDAKGNKAKFQGGKFVPVK